SVFLFFSLIVCNKNIYLIFSFIGCFIQSITLDYGKVCKSCLIKGKNAFKENFLWDTSSCSHLYKEKYFHVTSSLTRI
ncbi:hypothetical protein X975_13939, partial [Stegodyphus mimosarum]